MGNGMNKVLPGLYIGNFRDAKDLEQINANRITHIVSVHDNPKPCYDHIDYKCIDISDTPGQAISKHFVECIEFIHKARINGGGVLVHCIAGVSRSTTVVAAYLITVASIGWEDAIAAIRSVRSLVNPNYGFQQQLQQFEVLDAYKVREKLLRKYKSLDKSDIEQVQELLKAGRKSVDELANSMEASLRLGTTATFGSYARKKGDGEVGERDASS